MTEQLDPEIVISQTIAKHHHSPHHLDTADEVVEALSAAGYAITPRGRSMADAPRDGTHILIVNEHGEFDVVYWSKDSYFDGEFGWTHDGGDRFDPVKWWPLPSAK